LKTSDIDRAVALAEKYNWPKEAEYLRDGFVPNGFGKEVGRAIVDFKQEFPFGRRYPEYDDFVAKELAELRLLIARINLAKL